MGWWNPAEIASGQAKQAWDTTPVASGMTAGAQGWGKQIGAAIAADPTMAATAAVSSATTTANGVASGSPQMYGNWYQKNQGQLAAPTPYETWAQKQMGQPQTNRSDQAWQQFQQQTPANMNPYYENAGRVAESGINANAATHGAYGSSGMLAQDQEMRTNLGADQAKAEANYGLQRAQTGGTLAAAGDTSDRGYSQLMNSIGQGGNTAFMDRFKTGADAAAGATSEMRANNTDEWNRTTYLPQAYAGLEGTSYGGTFSTDADVSSKLAGYGVGAAVDNANRNASDPGFSGTVADLMQMYKTGQGMFSQPSTAAPYSGPYGGQYPDRPKK